MKHPIPATPDVRLVHGQGQSVQLSNVTAAKVQGRDFTLTFDLAWQGSWRCPPGQAPANWDAAWVFFKYNWVSAPTQVAVTPDIQAALQAGDAQRVIDLVNGSALLHFPQLAGSTSLDPDPVVKGAYQLAARPHDRTKAVVFDLQLSEDGQTLTIVMSYGPWEHGKVAPQSAPPDACVEATPDSDGVLVYRSQPTVDGRMEPVIFKGITLACTLPLLDLGRFSGTLELWPFAVEMVYVPAAPFHLGDPRGPRPGAPTNCFYDSVKPDAPDASYLVDSEDPIQVGTPATYPDARALLYYNNKDAVGGVGDQTGPVPAPFPKGFEAFYVMKRQITQGQYADFVNTLLALTPTDYGQVVRYPYDGQGTYRCTLHVSDATLFIRAATRPARAMNHLSWADGTAFAAWAALRPLTELEYEKACRGPVAPVSGEYAWGSTALVNGIVIMGDEAARSYVIGNCHLDQPTSPFLGGDGGLGPVEDDAFAANGVPGAAGSYSSVSMFATQPGSPLVAGSLLDRDATGRSYYGVASLTGNLWELAVTVGNPVGRAFTGDHGYGYVDDYGQAPTVAVGGTLSWPGPASWGFAFRGGSWYTAPSRGPVAARSFGSGAPGYFYRALDIGFRAARTAPPPAPPPSGSLPTIPPSPPASTPPASSPPPAP